MILWGKIVLSPLGALCRWKVRSSLIWIKNGWQVEDGWGVAVFEVESACVSKQNTLFTALRCGEEVQAVDWHPHPCFLWNTNQKKEGVYVYIRGFPGGSDNKISACNMGDPGLIPGSGRSPGEENGYTPVFLAGESHGQRSLEGYSPWGLKESDTAMGLTQHVHIQLIHFAVQ